MLTVEGQKLNSRYDTDQGQVIIRRRNFTVLNRTPKKGYCLFIPESASPQQSTVLTEKVGSPKRPLQLLFNFAKKSCSILILGIISDLQSEKFDIENKCSTICVCKIVLQNIYIKIQKSNFNINISNISDLPFDVMCVFTWKKMLMTLCQINQQSIGFSKQPANKNGANVLTLC